MTLHADALSVLSAWAPPSPDQALLRDRFVDHLSDRPDGLDRTCYPDHLTASTLVLSADRGYVLLTLHAKARQWFQFGGHCEPGDPTLAGAAAREAAEESGLASLILDPLPLHLSAHSVPFCHPSGPVDHLDVRFVAVTERVEPRVSAESLDVRWFPVGELPSREPSMLQLVDWAVARVGGD